MPVCLWTTSLQVRRQHQRVSWRVTTRRCFEMFGKLDVTTESEKNPLIRVIPSNHPHPPQSSLIEIKTHNWTRALDLNDTYGQLVFSQTPWLYVGRHKEGDFSVEPVQKLSLDDVDFLRTAEEQKEVIRRVGGMLRKMVEIVREEGKVGFVCVDGEVQVRKVTVESVSISETAPQVLRDARR